jgi:hypothetical protein
MASDAARKNLILTAFQGIKNAESEPEVQKHLQIFSAVDVLLTIFFVTAVNTENLRPIFQTFPYHQLQFVLVHLVRTCSEI